MTADHRPLTAAENDLYDFRRSAVCGLRSYLRQEKEADADNQIDAQQLQPFQSIALAIQGNQGRN
jgi:hypothetical protein